MFLWSNDRNKQRDFDKVPDKVLNKMFKQWSVPTLDECHDIERIIDVKN